MLIPCSECHRHVRQSEPTCPFCGGAPGAKRRAGSWARGATRAAIFYFGASLAAACGTDVPPEEAIAAPYGAPPEPPPEDPPDDLPEPPREEAIAAPYGAPPEPPPEDGPPEDAPPENGEPTLPDDDTEAE